MMRTGRSIADRPARDALPPARGQGLGLAILLSLLLWALLILAALHLVARFWP